MAIFLETETRTRTGFPKLHEASYDKIKFRMLDRFDETLIGNEQVGYQGLFTHVMERIYYLHPDIIMFPAYSAIPLADAVGSFYEHIATTAPNMTYIHANQSMTPTTNDMRPERVQQRIDREVKRLRSQVIGKSCVVLDHFTASGKTLTLAQQMLTHAEASRVDTFSPHAQWYFDIDEEDRDEVDLYNMTVPRHAQFMRDIGKRAAGRLKPRL